MALKRLTDNNYVHAATVRAYIRGWDDYVAAREKLDQNNIEAVAAFFFPGSIRMVSPHAQAQAIAKAYADGLEEAGLFDCGKAHGAIDLPRDQWLALLSDDQALAEYVLEKATKYTDRKYKIANAPSHHFTAPGIKIRSTFCCGVYHGNLKKGDLVDCCSHYVRITAVFQDSADAVELGSLEPEKAKVRSLNELSKDKEESGDVYLVQGDAKPDVGLEGLPTVESELKRILKDRSKTKKAKREKVAAKPANPSKRK